MVLYTVTVDCEEEWDWNGPFPIDSLRTSNIEALRAFDDVCKKHAARPTYFVNHAVMEDPMSRDVIRELHSRDGAEVGMHIHPWNTPPLVGESVAPRDSFLHNLPDELANQKMVSALQALTRDGIFPKSFRGGRYSSGPVVQSFLRENRFRVDASICPYSWWPDDGAPNYRYRGLEPASAGRNRDGAVLWEVPLTRAFSRRPFQFWQFCHSMAEGAVVSKLRLIGIAERCKLVRRLWLNFECESLANMQKFVQLATRWQISHICFTVHSSSLAEGPGPYCRTPADRERILGNVEQVLGELSDSHDFTPVTMVELADKLDEESQ